MKTKNSPDLTSATVLVPEQARQRKIGADPDLSQSAMQSPLSAKPVRARNTRRQFQRWVPYGGAVILIGLIIAGLWPRPVPVETARALVGSLRSTVNEEGKTRIKQLYVISAPVSGQLRRIPFKPGAEVKEGVTVLAVIDPLPPGLLDARSRTLAEARRDTAAANLERARAAHGFAVSELRRLEKLFAEKTISIQELENGQWRETATAKELAAGESAFRQAEAELLEFGKATETGKLHPVEIKAPVSGQVLRVIEESSRAVAAGTPLLEIGDPTDLEVVVEVLSRDGAAISAGTLVELERWGGNKPLQARVRLVEPSAFTKVSALGVEEQRVNLVADLITPPEERGNLGDQFRVEARIIIWEAEDVLKIPTGALFRQGQNWAVFNLREGRAVLQPVSIGHSSGTETQITAGLKEGDAVIVYPGDRIRANQRVEPLHISVGR